MAERTISVRLIALVDQYKQAMRDSAKSTDSVTDSAGRLQKMGGAVSELGSTLTRRVTLPLVALGGVATVMASEFDGAFTRMQTLAGVSADEVAGLKDSVLGLAGETGKAPQELAEALYFLRSSGLDGAAAMDALEMSAKASAAGLGSTVQVADAVSSAMNAYAKSGLSAAEATDVLVATARAGKAEPAELAAQMGRVLPVASELGVSFQDVGASIASLSLAGNDASTSTTQLTNLLSKMLKPSQQAGEALEAVGLSVDDLRGMIAEKGLLGTLEELRSRLGDNGFARFLEDQQAVLAGLSLTGENVAKNREIFKDLADSTGAASNAFETWAESMGAENARAFGEMQAAMIEFGENIAPIVADVLGFAASIARAFSDLSDGQQKALIGFLAVVAALGPMLSVVGNVMQVVGGLRKAFDAASSAASGFEGGMGRVGRTLAIGGGVLTAITLVSMELAKLDDAASNRRFEDIFGGDKLIANLNRTSEAAQQHVERLIMLEDKYGGLEDTVKGLADTNVNLAEKFIAAAEAAGLEDERIERLREVLTDHKAAAEASAEGGDSLTESMGEQAQATEEATEALQKHLDQLRAQFDPLFGMVDAIRSNRDAQIALTEAEAAANQARAEHGVGSAEATEAERNYADALDNSLKVSADLQFAAAELKGAIQNQGLSVEAATQTLVSWAVQAGYTEDQAYAMAASLGFGASEAHRLDGISVDVPVSAPGVDGVINSLYGVRAAVDSIDRYVGIEVEFHQTGGSGAQGHKARAMGGPVYAGRGYVVGEQGPEFFVPNEDGRIIPNHMIDTYASSTATSAMTGPVATGGSWGPQMVYVTFDLAGMDHRLADWFRHTVRTEGGGSVQVAFGQ